MGSNKVQNIKYHFHLVFIRNLKMSGRLVILPHKSWNVWNQDNKEKVLRDQRLFNEEIQRKADNEKRQSQEMNLQILQQFATRTEEESANECIFHFYFAQYIVRQAIML